MVARLAVSPVPEFMQQIQQRLAAPQTSWAVSFGFWRSFRDAQPLTSKRDWIEEKTRSACSRSGSSDEGKHHPIRPVREQRKVQAREYDLTLPRCHEPRMRILLESDASSYKPALPWVSKVAICNRLGCWSMVLMMRCRHYSFAPRRGAGLARRKCQFVSSIYGNIRRMLARARLELS